MILQSKRIDFITIDLTLVKKEEIKNNEKKQNRKRIKRKERKKEKRIIIFLLMIQIIKSILKKHKNLFSSISLKMKMKNRNHSYQIHSWKE